MEQKLPQQFTGRGEAAETSSIFWNQSFSSRLLQADVQALQRENFELDAARARVEQAAAIYGMEKSAQGLSLDAKMSLERLREKEDGEVTKENFLVLDTAFHWEPDIWGRLEARKEAARLSIKEQQAMADRIMLDLQTLLVETWIDHHGARKLEQLLIRQRNQNLQVLDLTELRLAKGQGSAKDVLQQRTRLAATDRELSATASRRQCAANAYAVLKGRFPTGQDLPEDKWPSLEQLPALTTPRQLLAHRPDLKGAFLALQGADRQTAAALADRLPRLDIGLWHGENHGVFSTVDNPVTFRFATSLLAPVLDAGRLNAKVVQQKAKVRELLALLEQAMRKAVHEVENALGREQALFLEQTLLRNQMAMAKKNVEKTEFRYAHGLDSYLYVLVGLVELQALERDEIRLQQDLLANRARLLKALGAKWSKGSQGTASARLMVP